MNPQQWIASNPPGTVLKGYSEENGTVYVDFLIREASSWLEVYPAQPNTELRAAAVVEAGALIVVTACKVIHDAPIYETFWDFHQPHPQQSPRTLFECMATEPVLNLNFVGDSGQVEYALQTPNTLRDFFRDITQQASAMRPWTLQQFELGKQTLAQAFPTPAELWEGLTNSSKTG